MTLRAPGGPTSGTVLYVEDNPSSVRLLERLPARRPGVTLATAATGAAALKTARTRRPDLILLDLHLPDMPGEEVLRQLWADQFARVIPVAILSADATHSQVNRFLAAGAVTYVPKSLQLTRLLELLDSKLRPLGNARATQVPVKANSMPQPSLEAVRTNVGRAS